jgi:hypothetical protein
MTFKLLLIGVCVFLCAGCATRYQVHIQTIPKTECDIFIDKVMLGQTSSDGTAIVTTKQRPISRKVLLEVKGRTGEYGSLVMDYNCDTSISKNVASVSCKTGDLQTYNVSFRFETTLNYPQASQSLNTAQKPEPRNTETDSETTNTVPARAPSNLRWVTIICVVLSLVNLIWITPMLTRH